ncbi:MAG: hypothetical protein R2800_12140 [Flavipsychrobacter sp.]
MKQFSYTNILLIGLLALFTLACNNEGEDRGPIILGNERTIVTETDSVYLQDLVLDLDFAPAEEEEVKEVLTDSVRFEQAKKNVVVSKEMMLSGGGLKVPFPQVTMFIPSITTRTFQEQDLKKAHGASYQITSGTLDNNYLILQGATIKEVAMRYQTVIMVSNDLGMLELTSLRKLTDWKSMEGKNGMYNLEELDIKNLDYTKVSNNAIRNAVNRATKSKRMRRSAQVSWENSVKDVSHTNQKPLYPVIRAVMWRVRGIDKDGNHFQKQLRIDIPVRIP